MSTIILLMVLNSGITTNSPAYNLTYLPNKQISFQDITGLTRVCAISGQYGIYVDGQLAFQVAGCGTDTEFKSGFELSEINKPGEAV